jgi:hypothetical protein
MRLRGILTRRRALAILTAAGACAVGSRSPARATVGFADLATQSPVLAALFTDRRSARAIGAAYLRTVDGAEASSEHLTRALLGDIGTTGARELRSKIGSRIRRDFAEHEVVTVDGWMLSRTEARLCALVALS